MPAFWVGPYAVAVAASVYRWSATPPKRCARRRALPAGVLTGRLSPTGR
ncbi:hypothetical protein C731_2806 [Mycolicibacterium hassiacum DSM 44199]|uniref:Uncharacterized protein n=1 Tax=Mycolicibacterium hassiacum (strain DSM 44199 / CIP 105218 / JCM 12690 / 3849) TaxID=1122247 RepID=K5BEQ4_MYCHD|nr:hypothetical protein C731_2806 [Mycolicibacterium hassiacum DSM 44199]